jgi:hypothetical protein
MKLFWKIIGWIIAIAILVALFITGAIVIAAIIFGVGLGFALMGGVEDGLTQATKPNDYNRYW